MSDPGHVFASHSLRLNGRAWGLVAGILLAAVLGGPAVWPRIEPFTPAPDYRVHYDFSSDYAFIDRWYRQAAVSHRALLVGDSVVWGEYTRPDQTLPAALNRLAGAGTIANLGVNGLHPAAMEGLLAGDTIRGRKVILTLNFLWMSSPQRDLSHAPASDEAAPTSFNHPALVPQFWPRVPAYRAPIEARLANTITRRVAFRRWIDHLQAKGGYFWKQDHARPKGRNDATAEPVLDREPPHPLYALRRAVPPPPSEPHSPALSWEEQEFPVTDFAWCAAEESLQWRCFRATVARLRAGGNDVLVLLAPFNPHLMAEECKPAYARLKQTAETWLKAHDTPFVAPAAPPSAEYADASHPLAAGYERIARELIADARFTAWLNRPAIGAHP